MKKITNIGNQIISEMIIQHISEEHGISEVQARKYVASLTFGEYLKISETITPPSGQTIGPTTQPKTTQSTQQKPEQQIKSVWPGKGAPVQVGMTVGLKDASGKPIPGQVSQVDMSAKGVKVKNPTTGKDEWMNTDNLEPFAVQPNSNMQNKNQTIQPGQQQTNEIQRLKELAGISENCSAGATGAGAIAIATAPVGKVKKREQTEETLKKEYAPAGPAKTIVGDTKPNQASGELSATLAANGKKTASRINNGIKRR